MASKSEPGIKAHASNLNSLSFWNAPQLCFSFHRNGGGAGGGNEDVIYSGEKSGVNLALMKQGGGWKRNTCVCLVH